MSDISSEGTGREDHCPDNSPQDCPSSSEDETSECCQPTQTTWVRKPWAKRLIFSVVILAAIGVSVFSLANRKDSRADEPGQLPSSVLPVADSERDSDETLADDKQESEAVSVACGLTLNSVEWLDKLAADRDVVFVLLPGEEEEPTRRASHLVLAVVDKLSTKKKQVAALALEKGANGYSEVVQQFEVRSFPTVVVLGRGCFSSAVSGDITEEKLLRSFVLATTPAPSCGTPSTGASCCPK